MGDFIALLVIGVVLFLAARPIIKFKKENKGSYGCYKCSCSQQSECSSCPSKDK